MTEQEIFKEKALSGYTVCFAEQCPLKGRCLHYLVGQQLPDSRSTYHCVNPRYQNVGTEQCSLFRHSAKVKFARGMMHSYAPISLPVIARPTIMSIATARVSSLLPSKRRYEPSSARLAGKKTSISTAMWRTTIGDTLSEGSV